MDYKYCVVEYDTDEDGPFERTNLFYTLKEAIEWADDCYGVIYKLEHIVRPVIL